MAAETKPGTPLIAGHKIALSFGERVIHKSLTFKIMPGDRIGVVGANGCGKSSFMKVLAGQLKITDGTLVVQDGLEVGYVAQEPELDEEKTVKENVEDGVRHIHEMITEYEGIGEKLGDVDADEMQKLLDKQQELQDKIEAKNGWEVDRHIEIAMSALRCPPADAKVKTLSGGERRRVALCRVLMQHPDLLILDEPTNHLDAWTIEWLESYLAGYGQGAYILVTHDRYFLDRVVKNMWELENGLGWGFEGNYSAYLEAKAKLLEQSDRENKGKRALYERELEWVRSSPKARTTKSKARIQQFDKLEADVKDISKRPEFVLDIPTGPPLSDLVLRVENLKKAYGDKLLIDGLTFELPKGGIVGVTGRNGAGKTTLVKMLMGMEKPDAGTIKIGERTKFCYVDQGRATLQDDKTAYEEVSGGLEWITVGSQKINIRSYLARFLLTGSIQQTKVGELSGGERNRVQLAKLLRGGGNVIVLDEPTNDLDLQTLRIVEESLQAFPGCAIVISHDRYFLDRVATHVIAFEGDGKVAYVEGSFESYRTLKKAKGEDPNAVEKGKKVKMVK
jgi:energy-dependent translational throttle protein EttA